MVRPVSNPPNPWQTHSVELLGPPPEVELKVYEEEAKSIVSRNDSPDVPFTFSVNPYRGCFHACAYCYARPTHQYLDWGAGTDFDRRIVVKRNAPELLRDWLRRVRDEARERIVFSGVTDCYQPIEASYELTRRCLIACADHRRPTGIITKGALVERDLDVLATLRDRAGVRVYVSLAFLDDDVARRMEPFAAPPSRRLRTIRRLREAGIPVGLALAPVIPGLNDHAIPGLLEAAAEAGADVAFQTLLRLPAEVGEVFEDRLRQAFPDRADRVLSVLAQMRNGDVREGRFGMRMRGSGPRHELIERLFSIHARRLGLIARDQDVAFRSRIPRQGLLFDEADE
jgi:DNA repair photolyase